MEMTSVSLIYIFFLNDACFSSTRPFVYKLKHGVPNEKKKKKKQKQHTDKIETLLLTQSFFMELETYSPVQKLNKRDNPN